MCNDTTHARVSCAKPSAATRDHASRARACIHVSRVLSIPTGRYSPVNTRACVRAIPRACVIPGFRACPGARVRALQHSAPRSRVQGNAQARAPARVRAFQSRSAPPRALACEAQKFLRPPENFAVGLGGSGGSMPPNRPNSPGTDPALVGRRRRSGRSEQPDTGHRRANPGNPALR